jgi:glycosyltransferase involved in cell wall biosynthesis
LNVLIVAQYFPPDLGGAATRAYNLAKGLTLNGCQVTVVAAVPHYPHGNIPKEYRWKPLKVEWIGKIKVIRTMMPPIKSIGFFKRLVLMGAFAGSSLFALPFSGKFDAIWASSWVPGYVYSKIKRKPLALNVDDLTLEDLVDLELVDKNAFYLKIAETIYRLFFVKADILTPISYDYSETMIKKYCVKPSKIHLIRGGVDLSVFKSRISKTQSKNKFVVLYSGSFSVAYDFDQIFEAAKIIEGIDGDVEFVVQGAGELLGSMYKSVETMKVKNVTIINKILSRTEVGELLGKADVLILPLSKFYKSGKPYRGMSSKLYEYQAVGKPIICCSKGVSSTYVKESHSGLVVDPGDSEALANGILKLKHDPTLASGMGKNGRRYVENEASIEVVGSNLLQIMQKECEV